MDRRSLVHYLAGTTVASSLIWSGGPLGRGIGLQALTSSLLVLTCFLAWKGDLVRKPSWLLIAIAFLFLISGLGAQNPIESLMYSLTWSLIILSLTSLSLDWKKPEAYFPIVFVLLIGIPHSLYILLFGDSTQGQGLAGNASFYAGQLVLVSLLVPNKILSATLALSVGLTGARAALGILLIFSSWRNKVILLTLGSLLAGSLWLVIGWTPYERLTMSELGGSWRIERIQESWNRLIESPKNLLIGTGMFNKETIGLENNPHNIYQIILEGVGIPLGIATILLLVASLYKTLAGQALLGLGFFDQFWLTTYQGLFLVALVLALNKTQKPKEERHLTLEEGINATQQSSKLPAN